MRVLVIGGKGSIGSRYVALLNHLNHEPVIYDFEDIHIPIDSIEFDKAIIATPTETHFHFCEALIDLDKTFLCEKPLSKNPEQCAQLAKYLNGYTVCNYAYLSGIKNPKISYNYYKTGSDGTLWDCSQLIYLDPEAEIKTDSPIWRLTVDGYPINYLNLEYSYLHMINDFVRGDYNNLWTLEDGYKMTVAVLDRMEREGRNPHSS